MTTPINDGGPAFPFPFPDGPEPVGNEFHDRCEGMTLRDYFAAKALQALIGRTSQEELEAVGARTIHRVLSIASYSVADAMIEQRNKT